MIAGDEAMERRDALRRGAGALAGALGFAALARTAVAAPGELPAAAIDVLNYALTLEHLEAEFYAQGLATPGLIPDRDRKIFETIGGHERQHVAFISETLGDSAGPKPVFDFSAGGAFDPFADYEDYRILSMAFEDTGVRAYKGQAIVQAARPLLDNPKLLTQALTIHSVEARHAARVRQLLGYEGWYPGAFPEAPRLVKPIYATDRTLAGDEPSFDVQTTNPFGTTLESASGASQDRITEAFDDPLSMKAVNNIASLFIDRS